MTEIDSSMNKQKHPRNGRRAGYDGTGFPQEWLILRNPQEWHDWLAQNHDQKDQIWLKIKKAHAKGEGILLAEAVEEALCFGWIDGKMYSLDEESFIIRVDASQIREASGRWSIGGVLRLWLRQEG